MKEIINFCRRGLKQCKKRLAYHGEFRLEIRSKYTLSEIGFYFIQLPPFSAVQLLRIGIQLEISYRSIYAYALLFHLRFKLISKKMDGIVFSKSKFLMRFAEECFQKHLAIGDMAAYSSIPLTGLYELRQRSLLKIYA